MPPRGPAAMAKGPGGGGGVLPVNPAALQVAPAKTASRLKLEIRRLPPGLTEEEFQDAFGGEWKVAGGKVDWCEYRQGKIKSPGKQPQQSRAYIHLTSEAHIRPFEAKFLSITFEDAKGTHKDPALRNLPPTLGFAPSQRVPGPKQRVDARQGTIDQDPEFIAFLEGETQPVTKPAALENSVTEKSKEKVTSTPLIEALREKKANKAKTSAAKASKAQRDESKEEKGSEKNAGKKAGKIDGNTKGGLRGGQAEKEVGKGSKKQAEKATTKDAGPSSPQPASATPAGGRKMERAPQNASIKSMLQRDLGLASPTKRGPKQASGSHDVSKDSTAPASATAVPSHAASEQDSAKSAKPSRAPRGAPLADKGNGQSATPAPAKGPAQPNVPKKDVAAQPAQKGPKGKANAKTAQAAAAPAAATPPASTNAPKPSKPAPQPSAGATKAYLKHANASQGITEALLTTALSEFGEVVSVEIDRRKGTALAGFKDHDSLKKAMAKRSLPVAQGAVEILEYREKPAAAQAARGSGGGPAAAPAGRGGSVRGRGRGGGGGGGRGGSSAATTAPKETSTTGVASTATAAPVTASTGDGT